MSSSYTGFGHCTLQTDCDDLDKLLNYLEQQEGTEAVGMVGHSTGCQDAVYFLKHGKHTVGGEEGGGMRGLSVVLPEGDCKSCIWKAVLMFPAAPAFLGVVQSRVRFIALQAPVSDREHLSMLPNTDTLIGLAKAFVYVLRWP